MYSQAIPAILLLILAVGAGAEEDIPHLQPGREVKVADVNPMAASGYFSLYLPKDYSADRAWPVIVYYHGAGAKPESGQMRHINEGRGFVIIGMQYHEGGPETEGNHLVRALDRIGKRVKIDRKHVIVGGASMGASRVPRIAASVPDAWSAMYLLSGAGRLGENEAKRIAGRPVFLSAGEKDVARNLVERRTSMYERMGVKLTFVIFKGIGHACNPEDPTMVEWFLTQGGIADRYPREAQKEKQ